MMINNYDDAIKSIKDALFFLEKQNENTQNITVASQYSKSQESEFNKLKEFLERPNWPEAVPDYLICKTTDEKDKMDRAYGIIDMSLYAISDSSKGEDFNIKNKMFLDFGCGEGHATIATTEMGAKSFGFDIEKQGNLIWETENENGFLTTDWDKIKEKGTFDFILIYDVLDHCKDPIDVLAKIKEVCSSSTRIFCRCHPWTGPHAGHYYQTINKAYIQIVFKEDEIKSLGLEPIFHQKIYFPIKETSRWIKEGGFKIIDQSTITVEISDFFEKNKIIKNRLTENYNGEFPKWQMSQSFNDYVLSIF